MKGKTIDYDEPSSPKATPVLDLMDRLKASLEQGKKKPARAEKKTAKQATTARKRKSA